MYIPCLNGIRAIAIFLVILSHSDSSENLPSALFTISHFAAYGTIGVRLFFLLSGFLITTLLVQELRKNGKIDIKKFFLRRMLRIFPCFYFYLLVLILLNYTQVITIDYNAIYFGFLYIQNWNMFQLTKAFPYSWLLGHSWSLSVEEQFYVVYPFIIKKISFLLSNRLLLFFIASCVGGTFFRLVNYSFPEISRMTGGCFFMHADFMLFGAGIATLLLNYKEKLTSVIYPFRNWLLLASVITVIIASRYEYQSGIKILICGNLMLLGNSYILLHFLLFPVSVLGKFLELRFMNFVGKLSYSLYVWQQLFLGATPLTDTYKFLTLFPLSLLAIIVCALLSYYVIELPFLRLKSRFSVHSFSNH